MKLLIGFDNEAAIDNIRKEFEKRGYRIDIIQKHSKASVVEYVNAHSDCQMVLLMENHIQGKYTADELAKITDLNDNVNVVLIADEARKGTVFLKQLYSAGIYGVIYQGVADKKGVSVPKIVDLLLHKRTKPEARQYYGIDEIAVEMESIPYYVLQQHYDIIREGENFGTNVGVRFYNVAQQLSTPQNVELIKNLPPDLANQLKQYEEFYDIVQQIEEYGISTGIVRPKELKRGGVQVGRNLLGDSGEDINMGHMNLNQLTGRFTNNQQDNQKNSYSSSSFQSMPLMRQANTNVIQDEEEVVNFETSSKQYQQPMFSQKEQATFRNNNSQQYNNMVRNNFSMEESSGPVKKRKSNSKKMIAVGCAVVAVVAIFGMGAVSLLKSRPTVIAKEQTTIEETSEEESYAMMEDVVEESEVYSSEYEESVEEPTVDVSESDELVSDEFIEGMVENPLMDVTAIVSEGSVVNQLVVDNIMTQYENDYNFVVYGLPDTAEAENTISDETDGDEAAESAVETISDKYYRVSLSKPGSIIFTEISLQ